MAEQIFISYSSNDRPWAERLHQELRQRLSGNYTFFFDRSSLRAGDAWEGEILSSLAQSTHMIVLWSHHAKASDWVNRERGHFDARLHAGSKPGQGRLIFVTLDNEAHAFASLQAVTSLRDGGHYAHPPQQTPTAVWREVGEKVETAITRTDYRSIPVAVLTMTQDRLAEIDFTAKPAMPGALTLEDILHNLGLQSSHDLSQYYGGTREEWKPFGGESTIAAILQKVRQDLNAGLESKFKWEWLDEALWSDDAEAMHAAAGRLANEQSVIVIDPIAFYESRMKAVFGQYLHKWLDNGQSTIMVLSIYPTWERPRYLRQMVSQMNNLIISRYDTPPTGIPYATCSVFTGDELDIKRLLRTMVQAQSSRKKPRNTFLRSA